MQAGPPSTCGPAPLASGSLEGEGESVGLRTDPPGTAEPCRTLTAPPDAVQNAQSQQRISGELGRSRRVDRNRK